MDKVDKLIEDIRVELNRLTGDKWPKANWAVGDKEKNQHAKLPRIEWEEAGGRIAIGKLVGGNTGNIATDEEDFIVTIWHSSRENCRGTLHNLVLATRHAAFGPNMKFGGYDWVDDEHLKSGRKLVVKVTLTIPVGTEVHPEAPIETLHHEVTVGGEVIC